LIKEDELPQIEQIIKMTVISITDRFMDNNGLELLNQVVGFIKEAKRNGTMEEITGHLLAIWLRLLSSQSHILSMFISAAQANLESSQ
jgi:hypothetical protein